MTAVVILVKQIINEAAEDTIATKVTLEHQRGWQATTIDYLAIIKLDSKNLEVVVSEAARRKIGHSFVVMDFASAKQFTAILFYQERSLGLPIGLLNFILIAAILDDY